MASQGIRIEFDASEADRLAVELEYIGRRTANDIQDDLKDAVKVITAKWRGIAKGTARQHGKHYPNAIRPEFVGPFSAVIGPLSAMPQGGMGRGFEYGSMNQPPHMDMNITVDREFPRFVKRVEATVARDIG